MSYIEKLKELYAQSSKHSHYQILSNKLTSLIGGHNIKVTSRYEKERLGYILKNVVVSGKNILDIGGNSGFFTFEVLERGANKVTYFEGNRIHSDFVSVATDALRYTNKVEIINDYYAFDQIDGRTYDVVFLLNVLHHLGDDYGDNKLSIGPAKEHMMAQLNSMAKITKNLVFQMGFNWKGNRDVCLFEHGTKKELVHFVANSVGEFWQIINIGIPVRFGANIAYVDLDESNIARDNSLGEFLNRPLFIMKSKHWA